MKLVIDVPDDICKSLNNGALGSKYNVHTIIFECIMNAEPLEKILEDIKTEILSNEWEVNYMNEFCGGYNSALYDSIKILDKYTIEKENN